MWTENGTYSAMDFTRKAEEIAANHDPDKVKDNKWNFKRMHRSDKEKRKHLSRMRTARLTVVGGGGCPGAGVYPGRGVCDHVTRRCTHSPLDPEVHTPDPEPDTLPPCKQND